MERQRGAGCVVVWLWVVLCGGAYGARVKGLHLWFSAPCGVRTCIQQGPMPCWQYVIVCELGCGITGDNGCDQQRMGT